MATESITTISEGAIIEGKLNFPGPVVIDGRVIGDITASQKLTIGKNAKVESVIYARDAVISGYVEGTMHVSGQIEITSTGKLIGELIQEAPALIIEKGGMFKGKSITGENDGSPEKKDEKKFFRKADNS
ncbi:MAG: polymer-forming cytoskeletal protein [Actinobacteria bacterium]|nr:polymer-forming cytoskeletal protein [Actinomycetota bacterium]